MTTSVVCPKCRRRLLAADLTEHEGTDYCRVRHAFYVRSAQGLIPLNNHWHGLCSEAGVPTVEDFVRLKNVDRSSKKGIGIMGLWGPVWVRHLMTSTKTRSRQKRLKLLRMLAESPDVTAAYMSAVALTNPARALMVIDDYR